MFMVTAFFSSIVIGFAQLTADRVQANQKLAFEIAVLAVLPDLYDPDSSLHEIFQKNVTPPNEELAGACTLEKDGQIQGYALPIVGPGFWAPIKGIIGIAADKKTITAIAFYQQNETPGLGGQILTSKFRDQFNGVIMSISDKPIRLMPVGSMLGEGDVHAVTGATQTSIRLEKIINDALENWQDKLGITK